MPNFTAGTSFTDGVTNDVTALKLEALVANAVPTSNLSLNSTTGTISLFSSGTGTAATPAIQPTGDANTGIFFPAADTIAFSEGGAEAVRIDSSGNVGIGTTSPINKLHLYNGTSSVGATQLELEGRYNAYGAGINFSSRTSDGGTLATMAKITADGEDSWSTTGTTQDAGLRFSTTANGTLAERLRIDSSGFLMAGATSQEGAVTFKFNAPNQDLLKIRNTSSSDAFGVTILMDATTANTQSMIRCFANTSTLVFAIAGNGNVTNTNNSYAAISDIKLKENIEDAASQWSDIKALNVRKFSFKNDESHSRFLGLIAQEVEQISPNLVEEYKDYEQVDVVGENGETKKENRPTGTTTKSVKYSILYMKAVKALQEAMVRIEALESKVTALEAA